MTPCRDRFQSRSASPSHGICRIDQESDGERTRCVHVKWNELSDSRCSLEASCSLSRPPHCEYSYGTFHECQRGIGRTLWEDSWDGQRSVHLWRAEPSELHDNLYRRLSQQDRCSSFLGHARCRCNGQQFRVQIPGTMLPPFPLRGDTLHKAAERSLGGWAMSGRFVKGHHGSHGR